MKHPQFDVIVIGAGHAGAEAAFAAARSGSRTALVSLSRDDIGVMSCNPAIGGLGKGHLVREIDAMGGMMGIAADRSGIQFRLLNRRKGPAVQGPRTQSDRNLYKAAARAIICENRHLEFIEGEVVDLIMENHAIAGVRLGDGSDVTASAVVLTTGTFLNGVIHIGDESFAAGRMGNKSSLPLAARMADLGLALGRLKTGTPPRLRKSTIDWDMLEKQPADEDPVMFSFLSQRPFVQQVDCAITHTNTQTHEIIQENLHRSAMYGGTIEGTGPRYCPSIEDKIVRFSDKSSHQVFLEPEGLDSDVVYPNGISTSLPRDVQDSYVRSMVGLQKVDILQPGYAIEYDFIDPRCLDSTLHLEQVPGLFLAGQINGTTGYEEAAAQGLIAGLNASRRAQRAEKVTLGRDEAYIGVMIDDLVTRGVTEPYRMFTSRAEYRLTLRADNADQRLTPLAQNLQILSPERVAAFDVKMEELQRGHDLLACAVFTPQQAKAANIRVNQDGKKRSAFDILGFPDVTADSLANLVPEIANMSDDTLRQLQIEATYAVYEERQKASIAGMQRDESVRIPTDFDFQHLSGLSNELKAKLTHIRPETLGQAGRIEGMTPAALALILTRVRLKEKRSA